MPESEIAFAMPSSYETASMTRIFRAFSSSISARSLRAAAPAEPASPPSTIRTWRVSDLAPLSCFIEPPGR